MKSLRILVIVILFACGITVNAQQILVKDIFHIENDLSARTSPRQAPDGAYCALLKINLPTASIIDFEGIVGESEYSPGEYKVYVPAHTRRISFAVPGYQGGIIDFTSFGLELDGKETYRVTMAFPHGSDEIGNLRILSNPGGQIVFVDGIPIGETPVVAEGLAVGKHMVSVANTNGFSCEDVPVIIKKGITTEVTLNLVEQSYYPFVFAFEGAPDTGDEYPLKKLISSFHGKKGVREYSGRIVVPYEYDAISPDGMGLDEPEEDYYVVMQNARYGIFKPGKGLVVPCIYEKIYHPGKLLAIEQSVGRTHVYQYMDTEGRLLTDRAYPYVQKWPKELPAMVRSDQSLYGYVDQNGQFCIPARYKLASVFFGGYALARRADGTDCVIDRAGHETSIPEGYEVDFDQRFRIEDELIHEGAFVVRNKENGKLGYADIQGRIIKEGMFDRVYPFKYGFASVILNQDEYLCDKNGFLLEAIGRKQVYKYICEKKDGKYGLHLNGKTLLNYEFDEIEYVSEEVITAHKNEETLLYDKDLNFLFTVPGDIDLVSAKDGILILYDPDTQQIGYFRENGEVIVPCICDLDLAVSMGNMSFDMISNGFALIEIGDRRGFINKDGVVLPYDYTAALPVDQNGHTIVRDRNEDWYDVYFDIEQGTLLRKTKIILPEPKSFPVQNLSQEEFVDLGVDVLWATKNLAASSPTDFGSYYTLTEALAEDRPQPDDIVYDLATLTAGNTSVRLPSKQDITDLLEQCTWELAKVNGVIGYVVSGKRPDYAENRVFFPASGWNGGHFVKEVGKTGSYWTSTPTTFSSGDKYIYTLVISSESVDPSISWGDGDGQLYNGSPCPPFAFSIRPVKGKSPGGPLKEPNLNKPKIVAEEKPQETLPKSEDIYENTVEYSQLTEKPTFNGGDVNTFSRWVNEHLEYPQSAKEYGIQGRVTVTFVVTSEGKVDKVRIKRGVEESLDAEAIRLVSSSPQWTPGTIDGKPVDVLFTFPIIFQLR